MKRVYVAGLYGYTENGIIGNLDNMRIGIRKSLEVLLSGYAPFVPWFDYHFQLMLRENETLTFDHYYNYSLAWLEVSDAILIISNHKESIGVNKEIEKAKELGIPVFYSLEELKKVVKNNMEVSKTKKPGDLSLVIKSAPEKGFWKWLLDKV